MESTYEIGQPLLILRSENKQARIKGRIPVFGSFKEIVDEAQGVPGKYASKYVGGSLSLENPLRLCYPIFVDNIYVPIITRDQFNPYVLKNIRVCKTLEESLRLFDEIGNNYRETY